MPRTSICHYLISLLNNAHRGIDRPGKYVNLCMIDFSKAFDHINHVTAIRKMIVIGVDRFILPTICSFLTQGTQTVRYRGVTSNLSHLTCAVPQGTKLGPIIFLIMVNDAALST